jgi:predicted metal-dependent HD superfamily phosphohydrolase
MSPISKRAMEALFRSFALCWQRAGCTQKPHGAWETLVWLYTDPSRHYHSLAHIAHCIYEFDNLSLKLHGKASIAVRLALWYHDAVRIPGYRYSEWHSADLAVRELSNAGCPAHIISVVHYLIRSTAHLKTSPKVDAASVDDFISHSLIISQRAARRAADTMLDVDLSIFGQPPDIYDRYETGIRREYHRVPDATFRERRTAILRSFLARDAIFRTEHFLDRYEDRARANLDRAIEQLRNHS